MWTLTIVLLEHRNAKKRAFGPIPRGHQAKNVSTVAAATPRESDGKEQTDRDAH